MMPMIYERPLVAVSSVMVVGGDSYVQHSVFESTKHTWIVEQSIKWNNVQDKINALNLLAFTLRSSILASLLSDITKACI